MMTRSVAVGDVMGYERDAERDVEWCGWRKLECLSIGILRARAKVSSSLAVRLARKACHILQRKSVIVKLSLFASDFCHSLHIVPSYPFTQIDAYLASRSSNNERRVSS
jgi:hypothetical protein